MSKGRNDRVPLSISFVVKSTSKSVNEDRYTGMLFTDTEVFEAVHYGLEFPAFSKSLIKSE